MLYFLKRTMIDEIDILHERYSYSVLVVRHSLHFTLALILLIFAEMIFLGCFTE